MAKKIREDLVQGIVDDAVARVARGEFDADNMDEAVDSILATADAFEEDLTEEEVQEGAKRLMQELA